MSNSKRFFFPLVAFFGMLLYGSAQNRQSGDPTFFNGHSYKKISQINSIMCDTFMHFDPLTDTLSLYKNTGTGNWGYISGHSSYKDMAKAEKFFASDYTAGSKLTGAIFFFAKAVDGDTATTMTVRVWDNPWPFTYPGSSLGNASLPISIMNTGDTGTVVMFPTPVNVSGDFYLGLDSFFYQAAQQDTVALYTNKKTNSHPANTAYEKWNDNTWHAFNESGTWGVKLSLKIAAILCDSTASGIQIINPTNQVILYPNPSDGNFYLQTNEENAGPVSITVFDAVGKMVFSTSGFSQKGGTFKVEMKDVAHGIYSVRLISGSKAFVKRIIVE